jgi:outer membrane receptor protein involved in Fe transport
MALGLITTRSDVPLPNILARRAGTGKVRGGARRVTRRSGLWPRGAVGVCVFLVTGSLVTAPLVTVALSAQQPTPRRDSAAVADSVRADSSRRALHQLAPVVVNSTRLSAASEATPAQIEQLDVKNTIPGPEVLNNALLALPGVSLFDDQGARLQPELEVRGFSVSPVVGNPQGVSVFLNGVRVNEPDAQEVNFDLLPAAAFDQASLVRGPDVLFGRNSLGGTLLLTTRRGEDHPEATLEIGGGSFGEQTLTATAGGKLGGIDGFFAFTGENEVGWRQATSSNTRNLFATIGHQWGPTRDSGDVALDIQYGHDKIYEAGSLPASYIAISPKINYTPGDFFEPEAVDLALRGTEPLAGGILRGTLFGRRNNVQQFNGNVPPPNTDGFTYNLSGGTTLEWTRPLAIGGVPVGWTMGVEYSRESAHIRLVNMGGGLPDSITTDATIHQDNAAAFAQAVVSVTPNMNVTGGLRADYVHVPYRDSLDAGNDGTNTYNRVSPEIGVTYRFTDDVKAFAGYKSGFRAPAPLELACASPTAPCSLPFSLGNDPRLEPVTTQDYEAGFDVDVTSRTSLDVDGFWTDVYHDIVFASPNLTQEYFLSAPHTRRAGVEASAQVGLPEGFRLVGSYSYVAATYQSSVLIATSDSNPQPTKPGDLFPLSPLHRGRIGAGVTHLFGALVFDGEFAIRGYQGQYLRGDESNQRKEVPGYTVAGVTARADYHQFGVELGIENLFNRQYYTFGIESQNVLGPYNQNNPPASPIVEPFYTPGYARRITVTLSARL